MCIRDRLWLLYQLHPCVLAYETWASKMSGSYDYCIRCTLVFWRMKRGQAKSLGAMIIVSGAPLCFGVKTWGKQNVWELWLLYQLHPCVLAYETWASQKSGCYCSLYTPLLRTSIFWRYCIACELYNICDFVCSIQMFGRLCSLWVYYKIVKTCQNNC